MNARVFNLALMFFWIALCIGLVTREWWMTPDMLERVGGQRAPMLIALSGLLAVWNFTRYFFARRVAPSGKLSPLAEEYRRKIRGMSTEDPKITDPQFVFDDPPKDTPTQPDAR